MRLSFSWIVPSVALAALAMLTPGCKKKGTGSSSGGPSAPVAPKASPVVAPPPPPAAAPSLPALADAIRKAGACDSSDLSFSYKCEAYKALSKTVADAAKAGATKVVETLASLVGDADPKVAKIAAFLSADSAVLTVIDKVSRQKVALEPAAGEAFVAALGKHTGVFAARLASTAAHVAAQTGKLQAFKAAFWSHADPTVAPEALKALLKYGRSEAFPIIEEAMQASAKPTWRQAASRAPLEMYNWMPNESAKLCPLGKAWIGDADLEVAASGAHVLARCKGPYVEDMLSEGLKRAEKGEWKKPFLWAYRDICFKGFFGSDPIPADDVCQKVYDFLETLAKNEKVGPWERGFALDMIYYQQRNERTLKRLRRYTKSDVAEVAKFAKDAIASLKKNYLKKK